MVGPFPHHVHGSPVLRQLRVLIIVQNLPVPLDRRVWLECQALQANGFGVTVICPKGAGDHAREEIGGVRIHKYAPAREARGVLGFAWEFAYSWVRTAALSLTAWREARFDVIQACNPPDTYWLLALLWRLRGVRFVYDQHDLNPELFVSRFGEPTGAPARIQHRGLLWLERMTYRVADRVISTNESYRQVAMRRGARAGSEVTVVRSGPDTARMRPVYPDPAIRGNADHLLAYLGIMGPQDNVDELLLVADELVHRRGRTSLRMVLLGFGDCLEALKAQSHQMGLDDHVHFTGRVGPAEISQYLSAADLGLGPDLKTPLNDVSTMNKTMEYMAYALPSVSYDLQEVRHSLGDAGLLVPSGDVSAFADAVESLLDDSARRVELGLAARRRVVEELDWRAQAESYVGVYRALLGRDVEAPVIAAPVPSSAVGTVDLTDPVEAARFVASRTAPEPVTPDMLGHRAVDAGLG